MLNFKSSYSLVRSELLNTKFFIEYLLLIFFTTVSLTRILSNNLSGIYFALASNIQF